MPTRTLLNRKPSTIKPKRSKSRAALALVFILCAAASAFAQTAQTEAPATLTGRVMNGERGAAGVVVMLTPTDQQGRSRTVMRAKTDGEGRYRVTNVPPCHYQVVAFAPAYVVEGLDSFPPGKPLTLSAGDVADN